MECFNYRFYFAHSGITSSYVLFSKEKYWKKYCQYKYSIPVFNNIFGRYWYWVFNNIFDRYWYWVFNNILGRYWYWLFNTL